MPSVGIGKPSWPLMPIGVALTITSAPATAGSGASSTVTSPFPTSAASWRASSHGNSGSGVSALGSARAAAVHLFPQVELFVIYAVMAMVLAFRPYGLFTQAQPRKI